MIVAQLRLEYHRKICQEIIRTAKGYPNFADKASKSSRAIAWGILENINLEPGRIQLRNKPLVTASSR
jgi:hypothetical protein